LPAYFMVDSEVTDPAGFEEYRKQGSGTVERYGEEYRVLKALRLRTARGSVVLVDGVTPERR